MEVRGERLIMLTMSFAFRIKNNKDNGIYVVGDAPHCVHMAPWEGAGGAQWKHT